MSIKLKSLCLGCILAFSSNVFALATDEPSDEGILTAALSVANNLITNGKNPGLCNALAGLINKGINPNQDEVDILVAGLDVCGKVVK